MAGCFDECFARFYLVPLSNGTYTLQLHGQDEIFIAMDLTIQCVVTKSGIP